MKISRDLIIYSVAFSILLVAGIALYYTYEESTNVEKSEWAYEMTQLRTMNSQGYKGAGVVVGIVDTGIEPKHKDLNHVEIVAWKDFVNDKENPYDDNGHGTHVAGIICAKGDITGGAPEVGLIVVKAINSKGEGTDEQVANGIDFCVEKGADVICLSLGGGRWLFVGNQAESACERATDSGVFVVAAAGNDGESDDGDVASPATVDSVIAVGAVDKNKLIASFSSVGDNEGLIDVPAPFPDPDDRVDPDKKPELVAPGVAISSTWSTNSYATASGTSQATPFVCSAIAVILDDRALAKYRHDGAEGGSSDTVNKFKNAFMNSSEKLQKQEQPHDDYYGYGLVQTYKAFTELQSG